MPWTFRAAVNSSSPWQNVETCPLWLKRCKVEILLGLSDSGVMVYMVLSGSCWAFWGPESGKALRRTPTLGMMVLGDSTTFLPFIHLFIH